MAGQDNITPTRAFQPAGVGLLQGIHDFKFATRAIGAGVVPNTVDFFGAPPVADPTQDRYDQGNTLVSSGKSFIIYQISLMLFKLAPDAHVVDLEQLINKCHIRLTTASKEFGIYPVKDLVAGGGLFAGAGQIAVTPATMPGGTVTTGVLNGHPLRKKFALKSPLEIQSNQSFRAELLAPGGALAITLLSATTLRLELEGVETRPAA